MMHMLTVWVYTGCVVAALVVAWWSRRHPDRIMPVGDVVDSVLASRASRITLLVFWWWVGWHFLVG